MLNLIPRLFGCRSVAAVQPAEEVNKNEGNGEVGTRRFFPRWWVTGEELQEVAQKVVNTYLQVQQNQELIAIPLRDTTNQVFAAFGWQITKPRLDCLYSLISDSYDQRITKVQNILRNVIASQNNDITGGGAAASSSSSGTTTNDASALSQPLYNPQDVREMQETFQERLPLFRASPNALPIDAIGETHDNDRTTPRDFPSTLQLHVVPLSSPLSPNTSSDNDLSACSLAWAQRFAKYMKSSRQFNIDNYQASLKSTRQYMELQKTLRSYLRDCPDRDLISSYILHPNFYYEIQTKLLNNLHEQQPLLAPQDPTAEPEVQITVQRSHNTTPPIDILKVTVALTTPPLKDYGEENSPPCGCAHVEVTFTFHAILANQNPIISLSAITSRPIQFPYSSLQPVNGAPVISSIATSSLSSSSRTQSPTSVMDRTTSPNDMTPLVIPAESTDLSTEV